MLIVIKNSTSNNFLLELKLKELNAPFDLSFEVPITLSLSSYTLNILQNQYITSNIQKTKNNLSNSIKKRDKKQICNVNKNIKSFNNEMVVYY